MSRRYGLRDEQWAKIEDMLPGRKGSVGVTARDNRLFIEAVLYRDFVVGFRGETSRSDMEIFEWYISVSVCGQRKEFGK